MRFPTILSKYVLAVIYNADKFGLFFQVLSSKSLHIKHLKFIGGNFRKARVTGLAAAKRSQQSNIISKTIIDKTKFP